MFDSIKSLAFLLRRFRTEILECKWLILASMALLLLEVLFLLLEPWPLKYIIDNIVKENRQGEHVNTIILSACVAFILVCAIRGLATYWQMVGFATAGSRIITKIRNELYTHLQCLPLSFYNKSRTGDLLVKVVGDMSLLQEIAVTALMPLIGNFLVMAGIIFVLLWMNWQLAMIALCIVPLFILANIRIGAKIKSASLAQRRSESDMAATAAESIGGMRTVHAMALENVFSKTFSSFTNRDLKYNVVIKKLTAQLGRTVDILISCATATVLWYGAHLVLAGTLTAGDLVVFLAYMRLGYKPARNLAKYISRITKALAAGERIMELFSRSHDDSRKQRSLMPRPKGEITYSNVSFAYDNGHPVLENANIHIRPYQTVAVVGPSGSGKSSLVNLLLRLYQPSQGSITLDGREIHAYNIDSYRSHFSVVMQDTILFAGTIADNIAFGMSGTRHEKIVQAARSACAHDFIEKLPEQYNTWVGERGISLSTGQRQRIAIARAMLRDAPILVLDEPTTALDMENATVINRVVKKLSEGKTVVMVTHDIEQARQADLVLLVKDTKIESHASYDHLLQRHPAYLSFSHDNSKDTGT